MFRGIQKKEKALSADRALEILKTAKRGVLSVLGELGFPYGMPMNHFFDDESGILFFHAGRGGHREESIIKNKKVSFTTYIETKAEDTWAYDVESVIVFGEAEIIDDPVLSADVARKLCKKFTDDQDFINTEIEKYLKDTVIISVTPLHIAGKKIREQ